VVRNPDHLVLNCRQPVFGWSKNLKLKDWTVTVWRPSKQTNKQKKFQIQTTLFQPGNQQPGRLLWQPFVSLRLRSKLIPYTCWDPQSDTTTLTLVTLQEKETCEWWTYIHILELPAKLLDYFLRSNKSNINQYIYVCVNVYIYVCVYVHARVYICTRKYV